MKIPLRIKNVLLNTTIPVVPILDKILILALDSDSIF